MRIKANGISFNCRIDGPEVDAFRDAVRDTFLAVGRSPLTWRAPPGKQFTTTRRLRPGYDPEQVDAFLDKAERKLAAMESTDRPSGPLVSDALLVAWAEWADSTTFSERSWTSGYEATKVDGFRKKIRDTFLGARRSPVRAVKVRGKQFSTHRPGYDEKEVAALLDAAGIRLAAMERQEIPGVLCMSTDRPDGPLVSDAILAGWAEWADSTRFSTSRRREGYDTAAVDAFREEVRDTFPGTDTEWTVGEES